MQEYDVIILGAGAAGLMCAIEAGRRGRRVLVLERSNKPGKKILMSGGGRCNFTNYGVSPECYLSHNPHFCKSALKRFTQWDFIAMVEAHKIAYHEKTLGQLFCDGKSAEILSMLLAECDKAGVQIRLDCETLSVKIAGTYMLDTTLGKFSTKSLVVATGGLSIPTLGGSAFGYDIAKQFGLSVYPVRAGLVPLTWQPEDKEIFYELSGVAVDCIAQANETSFKEAMLFTHRGLSGPALLQISSFWQPGDELLLKLNPEEDLESVLHEAKSADPNRGIATILQGHFPKKLVKVFLEVNRIDSAKTLQQFSNVALGDIARLFQSWRPNLNGTEGYRTAEVTMGGVDTDELSSKTMEAKRQPGLYFIGEVVDVTGWLGGYNFQWAWSSGWVAGQFV